MDKRQDLIAWSMERVSEVHGDPTGVVYARLFAANPELERMFVLDTQGMARGAMLANVFDALLDMAGPRHYGLNLVLAECVNHEGIGVPPAIYATFFILVRDTMRDLLGAEWTPEVDAAWREVLSEIEAKLPA